jgi:hypothetical protein
VFVGVFAAEASLGPLDRFVGAVPLAGLVMVVRLGAERVGLVGDLVFDAVARHAANGVVPVLGARSGGSRSVWGWEEGMWRRCGVVGLWRLGVVVAG